MSRLNFLEVVRNYWPIGLSSLLIVLAFASCDAVKQSDSPTEVVPEEVQPIVYEEFTPDSSNWQSTPEIDVSAAFELDGFTLVSAFDHLSYNEDAYEQDTVNGWGDRLFLFNGKNEMLYKSKGVGDPYLYHPHFYRNDVNSKVYIVCQLGYEYWFGGDAFLFENGKLSYLGNIDVEGSEMETSLIDILNIQEMKDETIFSFEGDSVILDPGHDPVIVANDDLRYVYKNGKFTFLNERSR